MFCQNMKVKEHRIVPCKSFFICHAIFGSIVSETTNNKYKILNTYIHILLHKEMRNARDQFWHNFMSQLATWRVVIGKDVSPHDPLPHPYQLPLAM